jgi:hypothetical protein
MRSSSPSCGTAWKNLGQKNNAFKSWTLVDQILNAVLFLLIGLEVLVVRGVDPSSGARADPSGARGPLRIDDRSRDPAS